MSRVRPCSRFLPLPEGVFDAAVERGVGVDHLLELSGGHFGVDGHGERADHFTAVRADGGGTHEEASLPVLDQLDDPFVTHLMDPAASGRGNVGQAHPDPEATLLSLALGEPTAPTSGSVKVTRGTAW